MKCPICGNEEMQDGRLQTTDAMKLVLLKEEQRKKVFPKTSAVTAKVCSSCGYIALFSDK